MLNAAPKKIDSLSEIYSAERVDVSTLSRERETLFFDSTRDSVIETSLALRCKQG